MKRQEIKPCRCGECQFFPGDNVCCVKLDKTGIENAVVRSDSTPCNEIKAKEVKVKKILGGLVSIKY